MIPSTRPSKAILYLLIPLVTLSLAACSGPGFTRQNPVEVFDYSAVEIEIPGVPPGTYALFLEKCSGCHGPTGGGTSIAPALNSAELRARLDDQSLAQTITYGRPGTAMPAWGEILSEEEIASLVALIRNFDRLDEGQRAQILEGTPARSSPFSIMGWMHSRHGRQGPMMGEGHGMGPFGGMMGK